MEDWGISKPCLFRLMALYLRTVEFFRGKVEFGDTRASLSVSEETEDQRWEVIGLESQGEMQGAPQGSDHPAHTLLASRPD